MAYTNIWSKNGPLGSQAANTADDEFRKLRTDIEERISTLIDGWSTGSPTDPITFKPGATFLAGIADGSIPATKLDAALNAAIAAASVLELPVHISSAYYAAQTAATQGVITVLVNVGLAEVS